MIRVAENDTRSAQADRPARIEPQILRSLKRGFKPTLSRRAVLILNKFGDFYYRPKIIELNLFKKNFHSKGRFEVNQ
jgi:hypothetical protein